MRIVPESVFHPLYLACVVIDLNTCNTTQGTRDRSLGRKEVVSGLVFGSFDVESFFGKGIYYEDESNIIEYL